MNKFARSAVKHSVLLSKVNMEHPIISIISLVCRVKLYAVIMARGIREFLRYNWLAGLIINIPCVPTFFIECDHRILVSIFINPNPHTYSSIRKWSNGFISCVICKFIELFCPRQMKWSKYKQKQKKFIVSQKLILVNKRKTK